MTGCSCIRTILKHLLNVAVLQLELPASRRRAANVETKVAVYKSTVLSTLVYGCESWTLTADLWRRLQSFHRRCARTIYGITMWHVWQHHISTEHVLSNLSLQPITVYIAKRSLAWFGKVYRMPWHRRPRKLLTCWVSNPRVSGAATYAKTMFFQSF